MSRYVNDQLDINEVLLKEYDEKRSGRFKMSCPNPAHRDSDGSFEVYGENRGGHCFGCGKSYFPIDLIMFKRDITYWEALEVCESEYECDLEVKEGETKVETSEEALKYNRMKGIEIKSKKALSNFCVALKAIDEGNNEVFDKYAKMKGI